jgi:cell division septal protein FtsQ
MKRKRRRFAITLVSIMVLVGTSYLFGWSNIFPVKKISYLDNESKIVNQLKFEIAKAPSVISIGEPLARVDKRAITSRLRNLVWIDSVDISRNFLTGEVRIDVKPRDAIAVLDKANSNLMGFLDSNLELFYLDSDQVNDAEASGQVDWSSLPRLTLGNSSTELRSGVALILREMVNFKGNVLEITATNADRYRSKVVIAGRELDVYWGDVKEFPLKLEVLSKLMELKENRSAKFFDLSTPLSPIVRP